METFPGTRTHAESPRFEYRIAVKQYRGSSTIDSGLQRIIPAIRWWKSIRNSINSFLFSNSFAEGGTLDWREKSVYTFQRTSVGWFIPRMTNNLINPAGDSISFRANEWSTGSITRKIRFFTHSKSYLIGVFSPSSYDSWKTRWEKRIYFFTFTRASREREWINLPGSRRGRPGETRSVQFTTSHEVDSTDTPDFIGAINKVPYVRRMVFETLESLMRMGHEYGGGGSRNFVFPPRLAVRDCSSPAKRVPFSAWCIADAKSRSATLLSSLFKQTKKISNIIFFSESEK